MVFKAFKVFWLQCTNMTGHKISTQEVPSIHYSILPVTSIPVNYNKTHKSELKYEI